MDYKAVEKIEPYDAGLDISPRDFAEGLATWLDYPGGSYCIEGGTIDKLMRSYGVLPVGGAGGTGLQKVPDLHIYKRLKEIGEGEIACPGTNRIDKLWANIEQPPLLHIRVRYVFDKDGPHEKYYDQELTYSGKFSVWWVMYQQDQVN